MEHALKEKLYKRALYIYILFGLIVSDNKVSLLASKTQDFESDLS